MQKKYADFKLGVPDYVTVETEEERLVCQGGQTTVAAGATTVEFQNAGEHEDIFVTSEDAVRCVKLRWNYKIPKSARFLGDAWERTYGDAEWHGMSGNRYLPWYFLAKLSEKVLCFGVKVRPSAMCCWQVDTKGITLFLDVRCGNTGVQLKGRKLCAAQIVCMEAEGADTFETAQKFCEKMCTDPIFPEFPVYGSNNWYYAYGDSSEEEILSDTDYILKLTEGVKNPPFMVIDDCWQEHHRLDEYNGGPWTKGNDRFPDMKGLAQKLVEYEMGDVVLYVGENLSYPDEKIFQANASELTSYAGQALSVVCAYNEKARPAFSTHGIPDEKFIRGKAPMTKEEVRCVSLSKLRLQEDSICYDVGAGTGSVSVEMALRADQGQVFAVEKKDDAVALLYKNKQRFAADNLEIIKGEAPEALKELPVPTHAFIGGSSGNLKEIVALLLEKNQDVRIVINCITLETISEALEILKEYDFADQEAVPLTACRSKEIGRYHLMMGENPIYIITCQSPRAQI